MVEQELKSGDPEIKRNLQDALRKVSTAPPKTVDALLSSVRDRAAFLLRLNPVCGAPGGDASGSQLHDKWSQTLPSSALHPLMQVWSVNSASASPLLIFIACPCVHLFPRSGSQTMLPLTLAVGVA